MEKIAIKIASIVFTMLLTSLAAPASNKTNAAVPPAKGYAPVNGINMYYEVQGNGQPLLLLHGAYMTIEGPMREFAKELSKTHRVILAEFQAHGRSTDNNRDITYENLADDAAALLKYLNIDSADVMGYSMGAGTALQLAIRHPRLVKKMACVSVSYSDEGLQPAFKPLVPTITPQLFEGTIFKRQYDSLAPDKTHFPILVAKLKKLDMTPFNWEKEYAKIKKPLLLVFGDCDMTTIEHITQMVRKQGGNLPGDLGPMPRVQLAVLPATTHLGILSKINFINLLTQEFFASN